MQRGAGEKVGAESVAFAFSEPPFGLELRQNGKGEWTTTAGRTSAARGWNKPIRSHW
jgi:hypothetical protein